MSLKGFDYSVFIFGFIVLLCFLESASAIKCYNCSSVEDARCLDPFDTKANEDLLVDCADDPNNVTLCRKFDQTVRGDHRIFRTCAWVEHEKYDCYMGAAEYFKTRSCVCRTDGCNHASSFIIPVYLLLGASFFWICTSSWSQKA